MDDEVRLLETPVLSSAGRQAVETELRALLRHRRGARERRSRAIQDAFVSDVAILTTDERCSGLCADLGFDNEIEAAEALLEGRVIKIDTAAPDADRTVHVTTGLCSEREEVR